MCKVQSRPHQQQHPSQIYCTAVSILSRYLATVSLFCLFQLRSVMCLRSSFFLQKNPQSTTFVIIQVSLRGDSQTCKGFITAIASFVVSTVHTPWLLCICFFFYTLKFVLIFVFAFCDCVNKTEEMTSVRTHSTRMNKISVQCCLQGQGSQLIWICVCVYISTHTH